MASIARTESRQDEEIRPTSEWLEDNGANILHILLPGFSKEQLKISYVHTTRIIRVTGERQIANNKWNRFNQTYAVPQNCDVDNIRARFANGTLTITMLKSTIPPATPPKQEPKPATTQEAITSPQEDQEEIGKKRKESSCAPPEGGQESIERRKEPSKVGGDGRSWLSSIKERLLEKVRPSTYEGLAVEKEKRRQTMFNIGVASLVAVAFGAYLYYSYGSPGNAQE